MAPDSRPFSLASSSTSTISPSTSPISTPSTSKPSRSNLESSSMSCPFAKYASKSNPSSNHHHLHRHHPSTATLIPSTLSQHLKQGTAVAHRAVERSPGVRAVLAMGDQNKQGAWNMDRMDYIRWQLMLTCIYAAMELPILTHQVRHLQQATNTDSSSSSSTQNDYSNLILKPLISTSITPTSIDSKPIPILLALARTPSLLRDIEAHLEASKEETGLEVDDFIKAGKDAGLSGESEDLEKLEMEMKRVSSSLSKLNKREEIRSLELGLEFESQTIDLVDSLELLTNDQVKSTLRYVERLREIYESESRLESGGWILSHAYVRYLGDLSGGQHISKRVKQRWPITASNESSSDYGFEFYDFNSLGSSQEIKKLFKNGMNSGFELVTSTSSSNKDEILGSMLKEASLSFDLNRSLFDSLVPEDLRSGNDEKGSEIDTALLVQQHHQKFKHTSFIKSRLPCPMSVLRALGFQIPIRKQDDQGVQIKSQKAIRNINHGLLVSFLILFLSFALLFRKSNLNDSFSSDSVVIEPVGYNSYLISSQTPIPI